MRTDFPRWLVISAALIVLMVWGGSHVATWFNPDYVPPRDLHWMMGVLCGALFGISSRMKTPTKDPPEGGGTRNIHERRHIDIIVPPELEDDPSPTDRRGR